MLICDNVSFAGRCGPEKNVRGGCGSSLCGCGASAGTTCAGRGGIEIHVRVQSSAGARGAAAGKI